MRWLKRSLHSVLFCTFVWQLAVSISNLRNGKSSTKISNVEEQEQDSPSFSICYFPGDLLSGSFGPVESLSIMHDKADATLKAAIPLTYFSDNLADDDIKRYIDSARSHEGKASLVSTKLLLRLAEQTTETRIIWRCSGSSGTTYGSPTTTFPAEMLLSDAKPSRLPFAFIRHRSTW